MPRVHVAMIRQWFVFVRAALLILQTPMPNTAKSWQKDCWLQWCCISGVAPSQRELSAQGGSWPLYCEADNWSARCTLLMPNWSKEDSGHSSWSAETSCALLQNKISIARKVFFGEADERKLIGIAAMLCNIRGKEEAQRMKEADYYPPLKQKIN